MSLPLNDRNSFPGPLMLDLKGLSVRFDERQQLAHPMVGGVILFTRNFESLTQLQSLVQEIRDIAPHLIIAVDHEGGRVQRFREGFTHLPAMSVFGRLFQQNPDLAMRLCQDTGWLMASELACLDIDISFAPVLDRDYGLSKVIGDRAFSGETANIIRLANCFIEGMHEAGMAATGKHFPGHGGVEADSHHDIPVDTRNLNELMENDIHIFEALMASGIDAVMPAHIIYSKVDALPAGFSTRWLQDILRTQLKFNGVIFSDDLGMEGAAVAGDFTERAEAAIRAGCDMVLVCNHPEGARTVLHYLETRGIKPNPRLNAMRLNREKRLTTEQLQNTPRWKSTREHLSKLK